MLLYLTSNQKSGLIDGVTREMLMPSKKLVGKFSLKSFCHKGYAQLCHGQVLPD